MMKQVLLCHLVLSCLHEAGHGWFPFRNRAEFELIEFIYKEEQMSECSTKCLLKLIGALLVRHDDSPPFVSSDNIRATIDSILVGDISWQSFSTRYTRALPIGDPPHWMTTEYKVHVRYHGITIFDLWVSGNCIIVHKAVSSTGDWHTLLALEVASLAMDVWVWAGF